MSDKRELPNTSEGAGSNIVRVPSTLNANAPAFRPIRTTVPSDPVVEEPMVLNEPDPVVEEPMTDYALVPVAQQQMLDPDAFAPVSLQRPMVPYGFYPVVQWPMTPARYDPVAFRQPTTQGDPDSVPQSFDDRRSLYLTFSNGFPLTARQIFNFFNRTFESLVENVHVHKRNEEPPQFGKVTFTRTDIPDYVMNNLEKVFYYVDGSPMHCKRFVTKKTTVTGESSNAAANTASINPRDGTATASTSPRGGESHHSDEE